MCAGPRPLQADDEAEHQGGDPEETQLRHGPLMAERLHHTVSCHQELDQKGRVYYSKDIFSSLSFPKMNDILFLLYYKFSRLPQRIILGKKPCFFSYAPSQTTV